MATLRQARRTYEPSVVAAAVLADLAGASGVTIHLRGDRRHIQDDDARLLRAVIKTHLNIEMAATEEMVQIAGDVKPNAATIVPERADEVTTEGGLDVVSREEELRRTVEEIAQAGVLVSLFVDPDVAQIEASQRVGARQIEICTARYAELTDPIRHCEPNAIDMELTRIAECANRAGELGLQVAAGHGLTYRNVAAIAEIYPIEELNIGHNIIARAALVGLERAVREMIAAINGRLL
jgi:pyridoxine 5-phosphate synthase